MNIADAVDKAFNLFSDYELANGPKKREDGVEKRNNWIERLSENGCNPEDIVEVCRAFAENGKYWPSIGAIIQRLKSAYGYDDTAPAVVQDPVVVLIVPKDGRPYTAIIARHLVEDGRHSLPVNTPFDVLEIWKNQGWGAAVDKANRYDSYSDKPIRKSADVQQELFGGVA